MSELMLVNPKRRKRAKSKARRNPKRRRAMSALQAKYFGGKRKASGSGRKRRRSRRAAVAGVARRVGRRVRRHARRFASNRSGSLSLKPGALVKNTLIPAAVGGAGALLVDVAWGFLPVPASIKTGPMGPIAKAAGAIALGMVVSKVAGKEMGQRVTSGYLTVLAYNLLKGVVTKAMPQLPMGEYINGMGYIQSGTFMPDHSVAAYLPAPSANAAPMVTDNMHGYANYGDESF